MPVSITALHIDFTKTESINAGLGLLAKGVMDYYNGNQTGQTPGMFTNPYYWWEAGAAWGSMIDYWHYTGDETYNGVLKSSLLYQVGADWNYMPSNQTTTEGNDDQGFWGIAAMAAAEKNFSNPEGNQPGWAYLAQAVFNTMASRWDPDHCGGGLRWQIFTWNNGYNYKNTVSNGCFFMLASRLARYTGNSTYTEWAERIWDWMVEVKFIDTTHDFWVVYDGAGLITNCTDTDKLEWTYNSGLFLAGAAFMYNHTTDTKWLQRTAHIWERSKIFFIPDSKIMYEAACQPSNACDTNQRSFKGIFSRFLGLTSLMAPSLSPEIQQYLAAMSPGVLSSCTGGTDGHTCGLNWGNGSWDGVYGLGEQMSALEALQNRLVWTRPGLLTFSSGASSVSNGSAGTLNSHKYGASSLRIAKRDRVGASLLTGIILAILMLCTWWVLS